MAIVYLVVLSLVINSTVPAQRSKSEKRTLKTQKSSLKYSSMQAFSDGSGVYLEWQTESEPNNLGFFVYRLNDNGKILVSPSLIVGNYLQFGEKEGTGNKYHFFDGEGGLDSVYVIESLDVLDQKIQTAPIVPQYDFNAAEKASKNSAEAASKKKTMQPTQPARTELNLTKEIRKEVARYEALTDTNTHRMVVAQPGVKVGVKKEGFYRVSKAELQAAGFDVASNPDLWQLYLEGVEQAIIVGASGDYIEFYGKGVDTLESDTRIYYLINGSSSGKRINPVTLRPVGGTVTAKSYNQTFVKKDRIFYASGILNGDAGNYFGSPVTTSGANIKFNLTSVDFNQPESVLEINTQGSTQTQHQIRVIINGSELAQITGVGSRLLRGVFTIPTQYLRQGENTLQMISMSGTSFLESIRVTYNRGYVAQQNQLTFYTQNYRISNVEGFSSANVRAFDITNPNEPLIVRGSTTVQTENGFVLRIPSHRGRMMFAVDDSAIQTAASVTPNKPSTLSTPTHNAKLLIISHENFLAEAEAWANYRRAENVSVEVVDVADIYDEFNFGVLSAESIRSFLQYAKNNWQTAPQYVLLLGDTSYDPRNYEKLGLVNYVPTKLVDTIYTETGSDEALADFNNDGLAELAVGRIPARTPQDVSDALAKVVKFEQTLAQAPARGAIFASDLPNGYDFEGLSRRLADQLPSNIEKVFINRGVENAPTILLNEINKGRYLVNYSGHGNSSIWGSTAFFSNATVQQLTNAENQSVFTMLSCLNGYFVQTAGDSLSELLLKAKQGGAVSVWSSTGLTTPDIQESMATRFYNQLAAGNLTRLGDLISDSKSTINGGRDVRLSWVLLGDPMLKLK